MNILNVIRGFQKIYFLKDQGIKTKKKKRKEKQRSRNPIHARYIYLSDQGVI